MLKHSLKNKKLNPRLRAAASQADEAESMTLPKRLEKFSFLSRHKGKINSPKKLNKKDLEKYQRRFKKKFNIEFPIEDATSDENSDHEEITRNRNVIMLGTPKRARKEKARASKIRNYDIDTVSEKRNTQSLKEVKNSKENTLVTNTDKPSNSLAVQVGSTEATMDNGRE